MTKQLIFLACLLITLGVFTYTARRIAGFFSHTKAFRIDRWGKRFTLMMKVAIGQTKIFRMPMLGLAHALVFWGFCVILFGSIEMIIDGLSGSERILALLGPVYDVLMASGDVFALIVLVCIILFIARRLFLSIRRFEGSEMKHVSHTDALVALTLILLLMVSLLGMNAAYLALYRDEAHGVFPVAKTLLPLFEGMSMASVHVVHEIMWWSHILLVFIFANILPYSKHFHVFMSVPNVFLSRLEPLGHLPNMESVAKEVRMMMNPETAFAAPAEGEAAPSRFGVKDADDTTWKNYLDALTCTECGRCTAVCPANITGKKLSPRKIFMDLRARMKEKGPGLLKSGSAWDDGKSLLRDYISEEELWACTTCNACAQECPVNINHPTLIVDMRRYLVMEEAAAPGELNMIFTNIENNGAPWQFSPQDRMLWAENLEMNT